MKTQFLNTLLALIITVLVASCSSTMQPIAGIQQPTINTTITAQLENGLMRMDEAMAELYANGTRLAMASIYDPSYNSGKIEIQLLEFPSRKGLVTTQEIILYLSKLGLRPVTAVELISVDPTEITIIDKNLVPLGTRMKDGGADLFMLMSASSGKWCMSPIQNNDGWDTSASLIIPAVAVRRVQLGTQPIRPESTPVWTRVLFLYIRLQKPYDLSRSFYIY